MAHFLPTVTAVGVAMQPGHTEYVYRVGPDDRIRVRVEHDQREVIDFTVQHETRVAGRWKPVVRYDCAHDHPHRDLLDADGDVLPGGKLRLSGWPLKQALDHAAADLRTNWPTYRDEFLRRHP
jgi:hypothetical protein